MRPSDSCPGFSVRRGNAAEGKAMIVPTIHRNGTSQRTLEDQLATARGSLRRALECMEDARPNGRDYYPQGPDAWRHAMAEHADRLARVRAVLAELDAVHEAIGGAS